MALQSNVLAFALYEQFRLKNTRVVDAHDDNQICDMITIPSNEYELLKQGVRFVIFYMS